MVDTNAAISPVSDGSAKAGLPSPENRWLILSVLELILVIVLARVVLPRFLPDLKLGLFDTIGSVSAVTAGIYTAILPEQTRTHLLQHVQRVLQKPLTALILTVALIMLLLASCILQYTFKWVGPNTLTITLNGTQQTLSSTATDNGYEIYHKFGLAFVPFNVEAAAYSSRLEPLPLVSSPEIQIPLFVTEEQDDDYLKTTSDLFSSMFQLGTRQYLSDAACPPAENSDVTGGDSLRCARFKALVDLLKTMFVDKQSERATSGLSRFSKAYPQDPWITILQAGRAYLVENYRECTNDLDAGYVGKLKKWGFKKLATTALFFRGNCLLKAAAKPPSGMEAREIDAREMEVRKREVHGFLLSAAESFQQSELLARSIIREGEEFPIFAAANAILFQGISRMYASDLPTAQRNFERVGDIVPATTTDENLKLVKARALNADGYLYFIENQTPAARDKFEEALATYPAFSFATANRAFLDLTSSENEGEAMADLNSAIDEAGSANVDKKNPDVLFLAKLAKAHWTEMKKPNDPETLGAYVQLAHDVHQDTRDWASGPGLYNVRYAFLAMELSQSIYLQGPYYGDDFLALAYLCDAKKRLHSVPEAPILGSHVDEVDKLKGTLVDATRQLMNNVTAASRVYPSAGWYASIRGCTI